MERRSHPRQDLNVPLRIDTETRRDRFGITRNVSVRGVQFHSPSAFTVGDRIEVSLYGLGLECSNARTAGTVVRVERNTWDPRSAFPHITAVALDADIPTEPCTA